MRSLWQISKAVEQLELMREHARNMAAAGMAIEAKDQIPWWHVEARRIWAKFPDRRTITGMICGDPIFERSALGQEPKRKRKWVRDAATFFGGRVSA